MEKENKKSTFQGLTGKLLPWLRAFLDEDNPSFLNKTESSKVAKYNCVNENGFASIGCQNYRKLKERINSWLDEQKLSEAALKTKLVSLLDIKETKIITIKGELTDDEIPVNCIVIAKTENEKLNAQGDSYIEYQTILGINMEANEIQRRSLDMAFKVKGMYADQKVEITNLGDLGARLVEAHKRKK